MIEVKNISFSYAKKQILNEISFEVKSNECLVIAGANGSGKTTILKLIADIIKNKYGEIKIDGKIGYIPQGVALFDDMTVNDNIGFFYSLSNTQKPNVLPFLLDKYKNTKICNLSGGIAKITSIACALASNPDNILYDEPCANLDVSYVEEIKKMIKLQKESNKTIIYVGHIYDEFCDFYDKLLFICNNKSILYNKNELNKEKYLSLFEIGRKYEEV